MMDLTCLADGMTFPADSQATGINLNEIVVGPTGGGKTWSIVYPRLLHTFSSSVVVPITKRDVRDKFAAMFAERGYDVIHLDFTNMESSSIGYDPMDYLHSDEDVLALARNLVGNDIFSHHDPYWEEGGISVLAAEMMLVRLNAQSRKEKAKFTDVLKLHRSLRVSGKSELMENSLDFLFDMAENKYPGNQASALWRTVQNLAPRTASCIFSVANNALDKLFSKDVMKLLNAPERISFERLGERKTALFITTSPFNKSTQKLINLMYADMFRALFEAAEKRRTGRLKVPVHIICDDFACGSKISEFDEYISIFRAAGISVTLLLQSESQLVSMYGERSAVTIINNCDSYVYMGGMDVETCRSISQRLNKPMDKVMMLPLEQVVVFRRGNVPVMAKRYQILDDPLYAAMNHAFTEREEMIS